MLTTRLMSTRKNRSRTRAIRRNGRACRASSERWTAEFPAAPTAMVGGIISRKLEFEMEVVRITPRGYCHGVVDAFRIAKRVREETTGPVHMLGMLVHNTHATDDLQQQGIALVDPPNRLQGLDQIKEGTVIFTAHGVSPQVKQRAIELGLNSIDATCSDVVRTHELVADLAGKGYEVVYIG